MELRGRAARRSIDRGGDTLNVKAAHCGRRVKATCAVEPGEQEQRTGTEVSCDSRLSNVGTGSCTDAPTANRCALRGFTHYGQAVYRRRFAGLPCTLAREGCALRTKSTTRSQRHRPSQYRQDLDAPAARWITHSMIAGRTLDSPSRCAQRHGTVCPRLELLDLADNLVKERF